MRRAAGMFVAVLAVRTLAAATDARWCLSMSGLGAVRAGMTVEQLLPMLDWSGLERKQRAGGCWYLRYDGPDAFRLMIIDDQAITFAFAE